MTANVYGGTDARVKKEGSKNAQALWSMRIKLCRFKILAVQLSLAPSTLPLLENLPRRSRYFRPARVED